MKILIPPFKSSPTHHFLLTAVTTILSIIGLICLIVASASCNFISVNYDYYSYNNNDSIGGQVSSESDSEMLISDGSMEGYEGDGFQTLPPPTSTSLGIYCSTSSSSPQHQQSNNDTMQIISRTITSLTIITCILLTILTCAFLCMPSMLHPVRMNKLWNVISYISIIIFIMEISIVLLLLESSICKTTTTTTTSTIYNTDTSTTNSSMYQEQEEVTITSVCTLSQGSITLFISMTCYLVLGIYIQFFVECPNNWYEEYELWMLMLSRDVNNVMSATTAAAAAAANKDEDGGDGGASSMEGGGELEVLERGDLMKRGATEETEEEEAEFATNDHVVDNEEQRTTTIMTIPIEEMNDKERISYYLREERLNKQVQVQQQQLQFNPSRLIIRDTKRQLEKKEILPFEFINVDYDDNSLVAANSKNNEQQQQPKIVLKQEAAAAAAAAADCVDKKNNQEEEEDNETLLVENRRNIGRGGNKADKALVMTTPERNNNDQLRVLNISPMTQYTAAEFQMEKKNDERRKEVTPSFKSIAEQAAYVPLKQKQQPAVITPNNNNNDRQSTTTTANNHEEDINSIYSFLSPDIRKAVASSTKRQVVTPMKEEEEEEASKKSASLSSSPPFSPSTPPPPPRLPPPTNDTNSVLVTPPRQQKLFTNTTNINATTTSMEDQMMYQQQQQQQQQKSRLTTAPPAPFVTPPRQQEEIQSNNNNNDTIAFEQMRSISPITTCTGLIEHQHNDVVTATTDAIIEDVNYVQQPLLLFDGGNEKKKKKNEEEDVVLNNVKDETGSDMMVTSGDQHGTPPPPPPPLPPGKSGAYDSDNSGTSNKSGHNTLSSSSLRRMLKHGQDKMKNSSQKGIFRRTKSNNKIDNNETTSPAVVSPDMKNKKDGHQHEQDDPELDMYPSESSMSTLSLPTDGDYNSSDYDDYRHSKTIRSHNTTNNGYQSVGGSDSGTSDSELSAVIAGVMKKNRLTSGKNTLPYNKRQRRRKKSGSSSSNGGRHRSDSSINSSLSGHGSLLDEVILEEETGELNSSMEKGKLNITMSSSSAPYANYFSDTSSRVPVMIIEASPNNKIKRRKSKGGNNNKDRGRSSRSSSDIHQRMADATARLQTKRSVGNDPDHDDDEPLLSGYESGSGRSASRHSYSDAASSDDWSGKKKKKGMISDAEESYSSRAARARRNRLLSKQHRVHAATVNDSGNHIPTTTNAITMSTSNTTMSVQQPIHPIHVVHVTDRGMNNRCPPTERVEEGGGRKNGSNTEQQHAAAWEARKVRMARLRMIRHQQHHHEQHADDNAASTTSLDPEGQCSDNNDNEAIIRADGLKCNSDGEDSI